MSNHNNKEIINKDGQIIQKQLLLDILTRKMKTL